MPFRSPVRVVVYHTLFVLLACGPAPVAGNGPGDAGTCRLGALVGSRRTLDCNGVVTDIDANACTLVSKDADSATLTCGSTTFEVELVGEDATCTLVDHGTGTATLTCGGTSVEVQLEREDETCTIDEHGDGTATLTCGDTAVVVRLESEAPPITRVVGSITIENSFDVAQLADVEEITGNLVVSTLAGLDALEFAKLERVGGAINLDAQPTLETLRFPKLVSAGSINFNGAAMLREFSAPLLATLDQEFVLSGSDSIAVLDLSSLASVGGQFVPYALDAPSPVTFRFPLLATVGSLVVQMLGPNVSLEFPALATATHGVSLLEVAVAPSLPVLETALFVSVQGGTRSFENFELAALTHLTQVGDVALNVRQVPDLRTLRLPALQAIGGTVTVDGNPELVEVLLGCPSLSGNMTIASNPLLESISMPGLATIDGGLTISGNASLDTLAMPLLRVVNGSVGISNNPSLSQCVVDGLGAALTTGSVNSSNNLACE